MKHIYDNYFHNRAELREELDGWLKEYYMACNAPHHPRYRGYLSKEQYMLFKCIYWVIQIGMPFEDIDYGYMQGYITKACTALLKSMRYKYPD